MKRGDSAEFSAQDATCTGRALPIPFIRLAFLLTPMPLAACQSHGETEIASVEEAYYVVNRAHCESLWLCPRPDDAKWHLASVDDCLAALQHLSNRQTEHDLEVARRAGRLTVSTMNVRACAQAHLSCQVAEFISVDACWMLFSGNVPEGGACTRREECADSGRCVFDDSCPGTCRRRAEPGEPCSNTGDCKPHVGSSTDCILGVCVASSIGPTALEGGPCFVRTPHPVLNACERGLWCDYDFSAEVGVCQRASLLGEPCTEFQECGEVAECVNGVCNTFRPPGLGEACEPDSACAGELFCGGTCRAPLGRGAACLPVVDVCAAGLTCQRTADSETVGRCEPPGLYGAPCVHRSQCYGGSCNDHRCDLEFEVSLYCPP
jgi:hypothetical protein